eukprot:g1362.t1
MLRVFGFLGGTTLAITSGSYYVAYRKIANESTRKDSGSSRHSKTEDALHFSKTREVNASDRDNVDFVDRVVERAVLWSLALYSKTIMQVLNSTEYDGKHSEELARLIDSDRLGRGLITVSNHVTAIDDPGAVAALMPISSLATASNYRWTACATDRCFKSLSLIPFFRGGKVLPVERGGGLVQYGMNLMIAKLDRGDWIHMFPTGRRSGEGSLAPFKIGVGRL